MSRATIWRRVKEDPSFPRPIKLSEGVTCWSENEVSEWLEKLKGARNG
jgi:predicted DNA-binding transcriptional regulator AlpA